MGSNDSLASLWDTKEWYCVRTFTKSEWVGVLYFGMCADEMAPCSHSSPVRAVRFSHDGDLLAMATEDPKIDIVRWAQRFAH